MGKIVLLLVVSVLVFCGCNSISLDAGKLSESEKLTIIDMARYTITGMRKNKKFVSSAEADIINKKMPDVKVLYSGPRQGKMTISWPLESKTVNFVYSGKFLTDSAMWRMGITRYDKKISKKKINPLRKRERVEVSDFDDLRKTGGFPGNKRR